MQTAIMRASDYTSVDGYRDPVRAFLALPDREATREIARRFADLVSSGIARAPGYERNLVLTSLFGRKSPVRAEAVVQWLHTGRVAPAPIARPRCGELARQQVRETLTMATLLRDAWRNYPEMRPILVEGSPDAPQARPLDNVSVLRRTHRFVLLRMAGRLYVVDGARGLVFDSLRTYLNAVMLPGRRGEASTRLKWFRIVDGDREMDQEES